MNIEKIKVGDKFSTENKLLAELGYPKSSGNTRISQLKEVKQYFDYTKTGKVSRGKETNEIIITKKYSTPMPKNDKRLSKIHQWLKPTILSLERNKDGSPKSLGHKRLLLEEFCVIKKEDWKKFKGNNKIEFYKYYLLNDFKSKLQTSLKQLYKENEQFYYSYNYMLINNDKREFILATSQQKEYIDSIKSNTKDRIVAKYKLENSRNCSKTWKQLSYRYTSSLYKMINDECKTTFDADKCVEVITIDNRGEVCELAPEYIKNIKLYYKEKMENWIKDNLKKKENTEERMKDVINFHNLIFQVKM